ncbi:carbohydrate ABC transporter permease [Paenibacillus sp. J5C_2022]|uniref:carbohydrate ABC transporter permease n=1 Tax=Paenibacillus sp. J5C2022 TaxID=2977129 RepID=UPI0021CF5928|nr:carbohydrate ABC transporter permease [Paenibacillus sp. J5C2022]MCU6711869.1 carbohydrate ABC transporter permease [Paenibacillus sp. J5C2022]
MKQSAASKIFSVSNYSFLIALSFVTLYPLWHVMSLSLSSKTEALSGGLFLWPRDFTWTAYADILSADYIWNAYGNTIYITFVGTFLNLLFTSSTAYALSKRTLPWLKVWIVMILFAMLFSGGMIPNYMVVKELGLLNTHMALIIPNLISSFNVIIMLNFIRSIPEEVEESAMIDGANPIHIFFRIIIPLCKPVLATLALWVGVGLWNNFFQALIYLNDKELTTLPLLLRNIIEGQQQFEEMGMLSDSSTESVIAATIIISIIPIIAVYPFLQRFFAKGIMLGSVKS